jgi:hypothetical protein
MADTRLLQRGTKPVPRPHSPAPGPAPRIAKVRKVPYWRGARRIYFEHWVAAAMVALAFANAVRLLAQ